jgi:hypothetical protein
VVGGNGYVGNYFAARLVRQGASVMAMSRYCWLHAGRASSTATPRTRTSTGWLETSSPPTSFSPKSTAQTQSCTQLGRCSTAQSRGVLPLEAQGRTSRSTGTPSRLCSHTCRPPNAWSISPPTRTRPSSPGTSPLSTRPNSCCGPPLTMATAFVPASSSALSIAGGACPSSTPSLPGARHTPTCMEW